MDAKQKAIDALKASFDELTAKAEAINKAKADAYKAAEDRAKAAKDEADRIFNESMKQFKDEEKEAKAIKKALAALGVTVNLPKAAKSKTTKTKVAKPFVIPRLYADAKNVDQKICFALKAIKTGTVKQIIEQLKVLEPNISETTLNNIDQRISALKGRGEILDTKEREGKAVIYKLA